MEFTLGKSYKTQNGTEEEEKPADVLYDTVARRTWVVVAASWEKNSTGIRSRGEARLMCMANKNFTEESPVPSSSSREMEASVGLLVALLMVGLVLVG